MKLLKTRKRTNHNASAPRMCPEELFDLITAPKPIAETATEPARQLIKLSVEIEDIGGGNWYVFVNGKPVARYESREDAETCARNW